MSAAAAAVAAALTAILLLLLEAPGGALAQGASNDVKPTPADLDRSILLEWRAGSPQLQRVWGDANAPVSAWEGVKVGAEGRVVKIELHAKDLTGVVPAALGGLAALTDLDLFANQLTSVTAELGNFTALKKPNLGDNRLGSVPAVLGRLTLLKRLDLGSNQLTSVPAELGGLSKLKQGVIRGQLGVMMGDLGVIWG